MIIDLIDKLIDRCIQLLKHSHEVQKNLFDDFATPVYKDFESVHDEYIKSFRGYRDIIKAEDDFSTVCDSLCEKIEEDILFNAGPRAKLIELSKVMEDPVFGAFIHRIFRYVLNTAEVVLGTHEASKIQLIETQLWRNALIGELKEIKKQYLGSDGKKRALSELDKIVQEMQFGYSMVTSIYAELKQKLAR